MNFAIRKKFSKIFLDNIYDFVVKKITLKLGTEMDQLKKIEFGGGYYFYWYFYAWVCPPHGS
jgi:hypothetical protein